MSSDKYDIERLHGTGSIQVRDRGNGNVRFKARWRTPFGEERSKTFFDLGECHEFLDEMMEQGEPFSPEAVKEILWDILENETSNPYEAVDLLVDRIPRGWYRKTLQWGLLPRVRESSNYRRKKQVKHLREGGEVDLTQDIWVPGESGGTKGGEHKPVGDVTIEELRRIVEYYREQVDWYEYNAEGYESLINRMEERGINVIHDFPVEERALALNGIGLNNLRQRKRNARNVGGAKKVTLSTDMAGMVLSLRAQGETLTAIANFLNKKGVRRRSPDAKWNSANVSKWLDYYDINPEDAVE